MIEVVPQLHCGMNELVGSATADRTVDAVVLG
jgi:hypothetical protein